jgi:pimeloyl-ACP methyl ester carboxylesterase
MTGAAPRQQSAMMPITQFVPLETGITLHTRLRLGSGRPFVLLHGLSSNLETWDATARRLAAAGRTVVSVDQRGHGRSDKPAEGYDFATVTADLAALIAALDLHAPIVVGQSWGGNVALEFGVRYPDIASGLGFVDGGFIDLQQRPNGTWETTSQQLRPPYLTGTPVADLRSRIQAANSDWSAEGIEATLANFEHMPDGTVRPWLSFDKHMAILHALWEQRPPQLFGLVQVPVLVCVAQNVTDGWLEIKQRQVEAAHAGIARCEIHWFDHTHHDIHVQRPDALAAVLLDAADHGIWAVQEA